MCKNIYYKVKESSFNFYLDIYLTYLFEVTNFPRFLRDIQLKGRSDLTKMEEQVVDTVPDTLEEFFDKYPEVSSLTGSAT